MNNLNNAKISKWQLAALLLANRIFSVMTLSENGVNLGDYILWTVILTCVQGIIAIPVIIICSREEGKGFTCILRKKNIVLGNIVTVIYVIFLSLCAFMNGYRLVKLINTEFLTGGEIITSLLLAAACVYCANMGITALGRSSGVTLALFAAAFILTAVSSANSFDLQNYENYTSVTETGNAAVKVLSDGIFSGFGLVLYLTDHVREKGSLRFGVYAYLAASLVSAAVMGAFAWGVLGEKIALAQYPFMQACQFGFGDYFRRNDGLQVSLGVIFGVISISAYLSGVKGEAGELWQKRAE